MEFSFIGRGQWKEKFALHNATKLSVVFIMGYHMCSKILMMLDRIPPSIFPSDLLAVKFHNCSQPGEIMTI